MMNKLLILLGASIALSAAAPQTSTLKEDMRYLEGVADGSEMTVAAINTNLCVNFYKKNNEPLGSECLKFASIFERLNEKTLMVRVRVDGETKDGKNSTRNKKNSN